MKLSHLFTRTTREIPADEASKNAQLLIRAGFVNKAMSGVYAYLPLGLRVLNKIENIVRKHLNKIGGQEILMNALHPKDWWIKTDRWDPEKVDVLFRLDSQTGSEYALACSHEEQVTPIAQHYISSYKDLPDFNPETGQYPFAAYQIQTKFRDELRSKSGLLRGREFRMKDMYDFHKNSESANKYYELVKQTYLDIYNEMGLKAYAVHASGGMFTQNDSHEFQVICEAGEDEILYSEEDNFAVNIEVLENLKESGAKIPENLKKATSAEVGNIFKLGDKYTKAFSLTYNDENNQPGTPIMNCHGIGTSRCMGVIAEIYSDEKGLIWPESVAPFKFHLITQYNDKDEAATIQKIQDLANKLYNGKLVINTESMELVNQQNAQNYDECLWDDRIGVSLGQKLTDSELIGCPWTVLITKRSLENGGVELKNRASGQSVIVHI